MRNLCALLKNEGYCVFALTYGTLKDAPWSLSSIGGLGPIENSAAELRLFVDKVLEATGAKKIDKYISLAPIRQGSQVDIGVDFFHSIPAKIIDTLVNQGIILDCEFCISLGQNPAIIMHCKPKIPIYPPSATPTS